jgi:hypothetical protein
MCCCNSSGRQCCSPIVPPNEKAKNWRACLFVVIGFHFCIFIAKAIFMGFFSGATDLLAIIILWIALVRYDYCLIMFYIVLNLFEVFSLIVVLGYYI